MPKSNRGGKQGVTLNQQGWTPNYWQLSGSPVTLNLGTTPQPTPQPVPQPAPQPVQTPPPIQQNQPSVGYDAFKKMTDDQKADVIMQARNTQVPLFLAQNDLQKVMYGIKMFDKPTLVDDSVLDSTPGKELFRTVNATNDPTNRIKYTATDVAMQNIRGSVARVSDSGGSVHGRGFYYADNYQGSVVYGNRSGDVSKTAVIRAKLSPTAKTISTHAASTGVTKEINSGSKLGKVLSKIGHQDQTAVWALAKGYDAMVASNGYHVVINRGALIASKKVNPAGSRWK